MTITFEDWEAERMKDPEFRAAAEELEPDYRVAVRILKLESACRAADYVLEQVQIAFLPNSHNVRTARKKIADALEASLHLND